MGHRQITILQALLRVGMAAIVALTTLMPAFVVPAAAGRGDRTLHLYYTHTRETAKFTFRKNGQYDRKVLSKLNYFLRDWRRNEPTKMDPKLFDLIWETYRDVGASGPIHVVSAYRSPKTNNMLRSKSRGVAKNSRHTMGMAMDFFIPGVSLSKLRATAMSKQVGGVGYYPTSGSPFVHLDTGNVRAWPRMTRAQLKRVFPDGKTLHLPADGKVLSQKGYQLAKAEWTKCRSVPCNGRTSSSTTRVASDDGAPKRGLLDLFFNNDDNAPAPSTSPKSRRVTSVAVAPKPFDRPDALNTTAQEPTLLVASAPVPAAMPSQRIKQTPEPIAPGEILKPAFDSPSLAVAAIDANVPPAPRVLLSRELATQNATPSPTLTAYAPAAQPAPEAQRALDQLLARRLAEERAAAAAPLEAQTASTPVEEPKTPDNAPLKTVQDGKPARPGATFEIASDNLRTASLGASNELRQLGDFFNSSWNAVTNARAPEAKPLTAAPTKPLVKPSLHTHSGLNPVAKIAMRPAELIAPDMEHITEIFVDPRAISSARYAVLFENDTADFDPATEMGSHTNTKGFDQGYGFEIQTARFSGQRLIQLASR